MRKEFKEFASRGNVVDMAIGVILGSAFGKIVTSLVEDVIMPPIGLVLGKVDFTHLYINLSQERFSTLEEAKEAGAPTINYGTFINTVIDFLIVATVTFFLVRQVEQWRPKKNVVSSVSRRKPCPFCHSPISPRAIRCPHCTSALKGDLKVVIRSGGRKPSKEA
ncbi:large conductance mechanosensitive channel [Melghirimyces profundicolus]|uniref:Large-conductance mechanosensitive channel n=1 Tax=Melghirimyces profundicolus TaxID=1242148 RepID=A0A2T6C8B3_9BACL|nr:large conductance mechanosensitive channel protein MscL [Melghirimyces profundicolus]PTX64543.1 large conductance mechanosensitive channel [Melghirimyces profundicolus]